MINMYFFRKTISRALESCILPACFLEDSIEELIANLKSVIATSARKSKKELLMEKNEIYMPWWPKEPCALRTKTRKAYKLWSRNKTRPSSELYNASKALYRKELWKAKSQSWLFLSNSLSGPEMFSTLKQLSGKSNPITLSEQMVFDKRPIRLQYWKTVRDNFFTRKGVDEISWKVKMKCRSISLFWIVSLAPPVTEWELVSAIKFLNANSAPVFDGLTALLI